LPSGETHKLGVPGANGFSGAPIFLIVRSENRWTGRNINPNHHALAEKYVLLDNFYATGAITFDGHQWLEQGFVSDNVNGRSLRIPAATPGIFPMPCPRRC
jgi:hypothetical protein